MPPVPDYTTAEFSYRAVDARERSGQTRVGENAVTTEPSASVWEVARLILDNPDRSPADIAAEHGYSASEIADLMPIFLDTARTDWSLIADAGGWWPTTSSAADPDDLDGDAGEPLHEDLGELLDGPAAPDPVPRPGEAFGVAAPPVDEVSVDGSPDEASPGAPFSFDDPFDDDPFDDPFDTDPGTDAPFSFPAPTAQPADVEIDDAADGPYTG